jgi:predicted AAA+ superfamily ATPase
MTAHELDNWRRYLSEDDYTYLIQYIENIKNDIPNDKMIILSGPSRTGKSTLMNDIQIYLGRDLWGYSYPSCEIINNKHIPRLVLFPEISPVTLGKYTKDTRAIINLIKYKQSFLTATNFIDKINRTLSEYCRAINMEHVFPSHELFN